MLQKFLSVAPVSPGMAFIDQDSAPIAAVSKFLPNSFLCLDEWHVDKNQVNNVAAWCARSYRPFFERI